MGIEHGFQISFDGQDLRGGKAARNMPSRKEHPEPIVAYLSKELALGTIIHLHPGVGGKVHLNRFGVIPKPHQPGK